ncbi:IS256 family transposase [Candidatus Omnitrophota bacterium]
MENVKLLPQDKILQEWWQEVNKDFWQGTRKHIQKLVKELMESTVKSDLELYIERHEEEKDTEDLYRNGSYTRSLVTQFGLITDIEVPRLRGSGFRTKAFKRYRRYEDIVEDLIQDVFLAGVSTRRVGEAVSKLLDVKVSHAKVSSVTRRLDIKVREFHKRSILDEYQYLFLDGITLKVRYNNIYRNRKILVAYGITVFGERRLIAFTQAQGESFDAWEGLVNNLYKRGLKGDNLKLITTDGSKGLHSALAIVYPHVPLQRCWAHKLRNVSNYLKKIYQDECINDARDIYLAQSRYHALSIFKAWKRKWLNKSPHAVYCLEKDLEELLNVFQCPKNHWKKIRTTNVIERSFREVRRRTRVITCFTNLKSCERIIYAIFTHLNDNWKERPIKNFTQFS